MKIICHRGQWKTLQEKNTKSSLIRGIENFDGIEFDVRLYNDEIIISHDHTHDNMTLTFENLLKELISRNLKNKIFAINVKEDGLLKYFLYYKERFPNFFISNEIVFFDMSFPEKIIYIKNKFNVLERISEYEKDCLHSKNNTGIWIDSFDEYDYINQRLLKKLQKKFSSLYFVSPELHGKDIKKLLKIFEFKKINFDNVIICTDHPIIYSEGDYND